MIKFNFKDVIFEVKEVDGLYDLNDLRKQVDVVKNLPRENYPFKRFNSTSNMNDWKKSLSVKELEVYGYESSGRGRYTKTLANKLGLVAYASWLNTDFKLAIEEAFVALSEGRDADARNIVGENLLDMNFVTKVEERWKKYVKWCYENFRDVNTMYGGNMTRMVVASATGVAKVSNVKGKMDDGYIQKLAEQNNGAAIMAVNATLDLISNTMKTSMFKQQMYTREGKKEVYKTLREMLDWNEDDF